jgi:hypothetical protein
MRLLMAAAKMIADHRDYTRVPFQVDLVFRLAVDGNAVTVPTDHLDERLVWFQPVPLPLRPPAIEALPSPGLARRN